jgi:hypothetical protein
MIAFHRALAAGNGAATALAQTQQRLATDDTAAMATAAGFVCIGADYTFDSSLTDGQRRRPDGVADYTEASRSPIKPA